MENAEVGTEEDLGSLNWLHDLQFVEVSDRQGRWAGDMENLVGCIVRLTSLKAVDKTSAVSTKPRDGKNAWWMVLANVAVVGVLAVALATGQILWIDALFIAVVVSMANLVPLVMRRLGK